jgi:hypothetical protein
VALTGRATITPIRRACSNGVGPTATSPIRRRPAASARLPRIDRCSSADRFVAGVPLIRHPRDPGGHVCLAGIHCAGLPGERLGPWTGHPRDRPHRRSIMPAATSAPWDDRAGDVLLCARSLATAAASIGGGQSRCYSPGSGCPPGRCRRWRRSTRMPS